MKTELAVTVERMTALRDECYNAAQLKDFQVLHIEDGVVRNV